MARLQPWFNVVTPREDLREGKPLDASEFAVHLEQVRDQRAPDDYRIPERFFDRTYMANNLTDLASQVVRRLSGERVETSAVFNLATQFGGGKTHALTLLYHLANGGPAADAWKGVRHIRERAGVAAIPHSATAVFVGTEFDSISGRGGDGEPVRHTPWGEIAWQLGGAGAFAAIAEHDRSGTAPAGDVIRAFLPRGPVLILMDEVLSYSSRYRKAGLAAQLYNFLHNLSEEARGRDNLVLVVALPASELEMNPDDQRDFESLKKLLDRVGKAMVMSAESETSEIIRRRLFEWQAVPQEGRKAALEYAAWVREHQDLVGDLGGEHAEERFLAGYPFHPALLSVFERKWQSLPHFQKTRGTLRLLALWVSRAYQEGYKGAHKDPLIGLGTAPLEDPTFRHALFNQLGSSDLEGAVSTDIAGRNDAHALRLDRLAPDELRKARLHQKVATAIFFESNGGQTRAEATVPEIRLAVAEPDLNVAHVETALDALAESCYYLSVDRARYRFTLSPNLNKLLVDRRAAVDPHAVPARVRDVTRDIFKAGPAWADPIPFPAASNDVPDRPALALVVLGPEQGYVDPGKQETRAFVERLLREHGGSSRTYKSALFFAVPESASALYDEAKKLLAWEDIADDEDLLGRLDEAQKRQIEASTKKAQRDLQDAVWRAYKWVLYLGKDNAIKELDLGLIHSSAAGSLRELIRNRLMQVDEITESVGAGTLIRNWPPFKEWTTRAVRDAFYASPAFRRLLDAGALKQTIARGVSDGLLGYATKDGEGRLTNVQVDVALAAESVQLSDDTVILRAADARARRAAARSAHRDQGAAAAADAGRGVYLHRRLLRPAWRGPRRPTISLELERRADRRRRALYSGAERGVPDHRSDG